MTSTNKPCHRTSSFYRYFNTVCMLFTPILLGAIVFTVSKVNSASAACLFYACLSGFFLLAQIIAFVVSQTYYNDQIEEIKFRVLKNEEKEWNL